MKTKPFNELRKRMTPSQRAESEMQANLALLQLTLRELRDSLLSRVRSRSAER